MTWNHRVIRTEDAAGPFYAIHEVIYGDDEVVIGWTEEPVHVGAETARGLFWVLSVMTEALGKPVLQIVGDRLEDVEPAQELSDMLKAVLEHGKLVGKGDDEYAP
jgi:hypothetical protein